jgi:hydroxypyruvate reductase
MNTSPEARDPATFLRGLFVAAIASADPALCLPPHLPPVGKLSARGRIIVLGAGKAAASMARAVEEHYAGAGHEAVLAKLTGLVVTRYGHAVPCRHIEVVEAAHPLPDASGVAAARRILALAEGAGEDDFVLCLISGGGSSLLTLPADGLTLAHKQEVNEALLASGAAISEINTVRKHLSAIKGGRLAAAAAPAPILSLLISDVPGDDPATIASGPTTADPTRFSDAAAVLEKYRIAGPAEVIAHLGLARDETPKQGDKRLTGAETVIVARPADMLEAAAQTARAASVEPIVLGDAIEGEAREVARDHASRALDAAKGYSAFGKLPALLLSGGELTVTLRGDGRGGPNAEYLLALAMALEGHPCIHALACDTDGGDGSEDNAGAIIGPHTLARAASLGVDPAQALADNDSYGFFAALGDLVVSGPTLTNVNDFRAILITNSDAQAAASR